MSDRAIIRTNSRFTSRLLLLTVRNFALIGALGVGLAVPVVIGLRSQAAELVAVDRLKVLTDTVAAARATLKAEHPEVDSLKFAKDLAKRIADDQRDVVVRVTAEGSSLADAPARNEAVILKQLRTQTDPKQELMGETTFVGQRYLFRARAEMADLNAPGGSGLRVGDMVGASIYASKVQAQDQQLNLSLQVLTGVAGFLLSMVLLCAYAAHRLVLVDLLALEQVANGIAVGDEEALETPLATKRQDELGSLYRSLNNLRKSLGLSMRGEE